VAARPEGARHGTLQAATEPYRVHGLNDDGAPE
jgi:hypothetical protein